MRNYSIKPKSWQSFAKYLLDLDGRVTALQNYIDFSSPNKITLNYISNTDERVFYSIEQLQTLNIIKDLVFSTGTVKSVFLDKMYPGQLIYNNFGENINLYATYISENEINWETKQQEVLLQSDIIQGMAILCQPGINKYDIISLDSEGDFYVISNVLDNGDVVFSLLPKATAEYGLNYTFSLTAQNARWMYLDHETRYNETAYTPTNWTGFTLLSWSWPEDKRLIFIQTKYHTIWTRNSVISSEVMVKNNNNQYDEVFCELTSEISSRGVDKGSQSLYAINTNMNNNISDILNMKLYIY